MSDAVDEERLRGNERREMANGEVASLGGDRGGRWTRVIEGRMKDVPPARGSSFVIERHARGRAGVCAGSASSLLVVSVSSHFWGTRFEKFNGGFRPILRVCEPSSRWPIRFRQRSGWVTQSGRRAIPAFIDGDRDDDERGAGRRGRGWDRQIRPRIFRGGIRGPESTTSAGSARPGESRASSPVQAGVVDFGVGDPLLLRRPTASRAAVLGDPSGCAGAR